MMRRLMRRLKIYRAPGTIVGVRYWRDGNKVYLARDRVTRRGIQPEHAILRRGDILWVEHEENGRIRPLFSASSERIYC